MDRAHIFKHWNRETEKPGKEMSPRSTQNGDYGFLLLCVSLSSHLNLISTLELVLVSTDLALNTPSSVNNLWQLGLTESWYLRMRHPTSDQWP